MFSTRSAARNPLMWSASVILLAACVQSGNRTTPPDGETPAQATSAATVYRPYSNGHGYREIIYPDGTIQVSFRGDEATGPKEVEALLFLRMADLADARGEDRFIVLREDVDCVTSIKVSETTTCIIRQSADARFPYYFGGFVTGEDGLGQPVSEYEAAAFMRAEGPEDCRPDGNCFIVADVRAGALPR